MNKDDALISESYMQTQYIDLYKVDDDSINDHNQACLISIGFYLSENLSDIEVKLDPALTSLLFTASINDEYHTTLSVDGQVNITDGKAVAVYSTSSVYQPTRDPQDEVTRDFGGGDVVISINNRFDLESWKNAKVDIEETFDVSEAQVIINDIEEYAEQAFE